MKGLPPKNNLGLRIWGLVSITVITRDYLEVRFGLQYLTATWDWSYWRVSILHMISIPNTLNPKRVSLLFHLWPTRKSARKVGSPLKAANYRTDKSTLALWPVKQMDYSLLKEMS